MCIRDRAGAGQRRASGGGQLGDAGSQRPLPRLDNAARAQLLRAPAQGHEGVHRPGAAHGQNMKGSIDPALLTGRALVGYAHRCGYTLGLAHSRAGDPDVTLGYVGKGAELADAMWEFSEAYADQT